MTDLLFALVSDWGAPALALATFLSCLAVPVPTSLMMLAAGAFVASGDLGAVEVMTAALFGAVLGDQTGFGLGRGAGVLLTGWLRGRPARARLLARAEGMVAQRGSVAVFLSRWLFSPLGPYVNLLAGAAGMGRRRFMLMSVAGEAVWVGAYVGLGYAFAGQLTAVAGVLADSVGLLTSALVAVLTGLALLRRLKPRAPPPAGG